MFRAVSSFATQSKECMSEFENALNSLSPLIESGAMFKRIVVCGMGGSAFPMELLRVWLRSKVNLKVHRDYPSRLPSNESDSLYLLLSFSGNTEEVLACGEYLLAQDAWICGVSNGGRLTEWCERNQVPRVGFPSLPTDFQPRCAGGYFLGFVSLILDALGVTKGLAKELEYAFDSLAAKRNEIKAEGDRIAEFFDGGSRWMLGYASLAETVGRIARIKLNENAKVIVHYDNLPEFNHNQMVAAVRAGSSDSKFLFLSVMDC